MNTWVCESAEIAMSGAEMHLRKLILLGFFSPSPYIPQDLIFSGVHGKHRSHPFFLGRPRVLISARRPQAYPCSCSNFIPLEFGRPICLLFTYLCVLISCSSAPGKGQTAFSLSWGEERICLFCRFILSQQPFSL